MRSITIMYDSLNRNMLSAYGSKETITPNFHRLAEKCVTFDKFYAGSLPCMPARRELHTGRYNFLHRSWGPVEPYDKSSFQILSDNGIYTHFISDHAHYWQEGGLTYHNRYSTYEFIRGQEGDLWKPDTLGYEERLDFRRQDAINRVHMYEDEHPHVKAYNAGMEFLTKNLENDNWHLHLEYFDPHEPFFAPDKFRSLYGLEGVEGQDWPSYAPVDNEKTLELDRKNYCALLTMCDTYLGYILDFMDEHEMWKDTMLIVNTDHGYLLGEHEYLAKNYMPMYEELVRLPFFIWDPVSQDKGTRRSQLSQTIDIAPTLLNFHGFKKPKQMQGNSLLNVLRAHDCNRESALFGLFGKHVNVTDGRYVYMRAGRNEKLYEYTIMPTHIFTPFTVEELRDSDRTLVDDFAFSDGVPLMKIPATTQKAPNNSCYWYDRHMHFGDMLFDLELDSNQNHTINNKELELRMIRMLINALIESEAPYEQFERLGLTEYLDDGAEK